jgi:hypothetical protein
MRRWYVPLTVLGLGSIGAFLLSERGRSALRGIFQGFRGAPERWLEWNDSLDSELQRIQNAVNQIAESLDPNPELGHYPELGQ